MKKVNIKFLVIMSVLGISCLCSWKLYFDVYRQPDVVDIRSFPKVLGPWQSEEITITEDEFEILETRNAFARRYYTDDGKEVFLFIVYSQHNRKVSHPPEICFAGSGVSVVDKRTDFIPIPALEISIKSNKLLLEYGATVQLAFYWFKVGKRFTSNYLKQQALVALDSVLGRPASSALIRVMSTVHNNNEKEAESEIKDFSRIMVPLLSKYLP